MHPLLDVRDRLARVEVLRARLGAVHDRVTPFGFTRLHGRVSAGRRKRDGVPGGGLFVFHYIRDDRELTS